MSNIIITINTDNAAFEDDEEVEVARILRNLANRIEMAGCRAQGPLRDINGNIVGEFIIKEDHAN